MDIDINQIISEYSNYVYKIIDNIVGSNLSLEDKEEMLSDTFYLLWKNKDKVNKNLKSYLGTIARNVAYQKLRDNNIEFEYDDQKIINIRIENYNINDIIECLDKDDKEIFNLYYVYGYKIKEISKMNNVSISAIKMRLLRLKRKIRKAMKDE